MSLRTSVTLAAIAVLLAPGGLSRLAPTEPGPEGVADDPPAVRSKACVPAAGWPCNPLDGAGAVGWFIAPLFPLFTRLTRGQALDHPRRQQIFGYIQEHPGANFREVARSTGIAAGTVRHHLNVLGRSGLIVEHQHGSTVRFFENQSRFEQNWADLVLLREPPLGHLHAWLSEHPGSPQKAVLEGMEPHGWSRSTTQHRLARLVEGGLATIRLQGRLKIYTVVDRAKPQPAVVPASHGAGLQPTPA